jgi:tripartite-type tricarboxylate transporter receptor subunit TctC
MVRAIVVSLAIIAACTGVAQAQEWPTRTVSLVVPFPAGGPIDLIARIFSARLTEHLGQQVIVENVGGAGGMNGAYRVAKMTPDGYAFLFGNQATHTFSQILYKKPRYNSVTEFEPVAVVVSNAKVLAVRKDLPVDSLAEFIKYAKANQSRMQYGSAGVGSATHITCVLLDHAIGTKVTHVPYRGTALAMQDVIAGRIDYICDVTSTAAPHVKAKSVKALAVLSMARSAAFPDVPTAHEQGLKGFDADGWNAFFFPKGVPKQAVARLARATSAILDEPEVRKRLEAAGLSIPTTVQRTPDYLGKLVLNELKKWGPPMLASGMAQN